ncbi:MAG: photosynthetic complex assembly protein PuhC [Pseudomonadota bacterium]
MTDQSAHHAPTQIPLRKEGELVPKVLLRLMLFLALSTLALVSFAVLTDRPHVGVPENGPIAEERSLILELHRRGAVTVRDEEGAVIHNYSERDAGFISVIARGLDRKRFVEGVAKDLPVTLVKFEDGRTALMDPATGWRVDLDAFAAGNKARFNVFFDQ